METGIHIGIIVSVLAVVAVIYSAGFYLKPGLTPYAPPGSPIGPAPDDCKAACRQWQAARLARIAADQTLQTAQATYEVAKAMTNNAYWLMISALAVYVSALLNPGMAGYVFDFFVLYLAANGYYLFRLGEQHKAQAALQAAINARQEAFVAENTAYWTVINKCTPEQADECLSHQ